VERDNGRNRETERFGRNRLESRAIRFRNTFCPFSTPSTGLPGDVREARDDTIRLSRSRRFRSSM